MSGITTVNWPCSTDAESKDKAGPDCDIDRLVKFETAHVPALTGIVGLEFESSESLDQMVSLRTAADLSRYTRNVVVQT